MANQVEFVRSNGIEVQHGQAIVRNSTQVEDHEQLTWPTGRGSFWVQIAPSFFTDEIVKYSGLFSPNPSAF